MVAIKVDRLKIRFTNSIKYDHDKTKKFDILKLFHIRETDFTILTGFCMTDRHGIEPNKELVVPRCALAASTKLSTTFQYRKALVREVILGPKRPTGAFANVEKVRRVRKMLTPYSNILSDTFHIHRAVMHQVPMPKKLLIQMEHSNLRCSRKCDR